MSYYPGCHPDVLSYGDYRSKLQEYRRRQWLELNKCEDCGAVCNCGATGPEDCDCHVGPGEDCESLNHIDDKEGE